MPNTMVKVIVENISNKFGPSFLAGGVWHVSDKKYPVDLSKVKKGDELEIDVNEKWVKEFKVLSSDNAIPESSPRSAGGYAVGGGNKDVAIARATAVKAIFSSPLLYELVKEQDLSEAISQAKELAIEATNYILTGEFTGNK